MTNLTDKLRKHKGGIMLGLAITALVSWLAMMNSIKSYGSGQGIFKGYQTKSDDERIEYVFGPIGSAAQIYRIYGKPSLTDSLKIGKPYQFTTIKSSLPWDKRQIESIIPYRSEYSKNK